MKAVLPAKDLYLCPSSSGIYTAPAEDLIFHFYNEVKPSTHG